MMIEELLMTRLMTDSRVSVIECDMRVGVAGMMRLLFMIAVVSHHLMTAALTADRPYLLIHVSPMTAGELAAVWIRVCMIPGVRLSVT